MLGAGKQEDPDVVKQFDVTTPGDIRVNKGGGAPPVLVRRVRVKDLGPRLPVEPVCQYAILAAGFGFGLFPVGEWENVGRIQEVHIRMRVARGLRETVVEAAAPASGNMRHDPVKGDPA